MTDVKHSKYYYDNYRNLPFDYDQLKVNPIESKETTKDNKQVYDKVITLKVSEETFEAWELLCENWGDVIGYDNKSKIFEFAIIEALNVPIASLGGFTM